MQLCSVFATVVVSILLILPCISSFAFSPILGNRRNKGCCLYTPRLLQGLQESRQPQQEFPDYGKTTIEVDTIKLTKPQQTSSTSASWRRQDLFGTSLIDQTLQELQTDVDFQETQKRMQQVGLEGMTKDERLKRRRALNNLGIPPFEQFVSEQMRNKNDDSTTTPCSSTLSKATNAPATTVAVPNVGAAIMMKHQNKNNDISKQQQQQQPSMYRLERTTTKILQINIGLYCNQACAHCHVESSPLRKKEMMTAETAARCLYLLQNTPSITTLDITGGAPELNANFRYLVNMARSIRPHPNDLDIIDRCNLSVLQEPGQEDLVDFLKQNKVHIIASLPCYSKDNVNTQRGNGVFERSIAALLALNDAGYGQQGNSNGNGNDSDLILDLVYNPLGAFLPPPQGKLQAQYKQRLAQDFGIVFDKLYTITNMPIKRFADFLHRRGELEEYMSLLVRNFNKGTVEKLMCLDTVSIGWDGRIYDCDFNQQLGMGLAVPGGGKTIFDIESLDELTDVRIRTNNHCFGCTAGMGSS